MTNLDDVYRQVQWYTDNIDRFEKAANALTLAIADLPDMAADLLGWAEQNRAEALRLKASLAREWGSRIPA